MERKPTQEFTAKSLVNVVNTHLVTTGINVFHYINSPWVAYAINNYCIHQNSLTPRGIIVLVKLYTTQVNSQQ